LTIYVNMFQQPISVVEAASLGFLRLKSRRDPSNTSYLNVHQNHRASKFNLTGSNMRTHVISTSKNRTRATTIYIEYEHGNLHAKQRWNIHNMLNRQSQATHLCSDGTGNESWLLYLHDYRHKFAKENQSYEQQVVCLAGNYFHNDQMSCRLRLHAHMQGAS
jgi:hypothetical protein